mgnify:CR=1 FL=1
MNAPVLPAYGADAMHSYEPRSGHGLPHDPLTSLVAPRPIGWISTLSAQGTRNLAPYSFFNLFNYTPPILGFCSNGAKDTLALSAEYAMSGRTSCSSFGSVMLRPPNSIRTLLPT